MKSKSWKERPNEIYEKLQIDPATHTTSGKSRTVKQMSLLIPIEDFDNFRLMRDVKADSITAQLRDVMRSLDEREEMEPFLRLILADDAQTPHGPAELVDIFTHKLTHKSCHGMAAFILKGKSFKTVRPSDVSHQIYRLEKIEGLRFAIFATPGTVLDQAKEQFISTCERLKISYGFFEIGRAHV